ncbi:hypothetical protein [Listeria booriae]|uniref:hypothetical protein n=1 Tax=Listeria booriae TaxID=1552123 RepID=UPI00162500ED|nr:hypothetical protein [Listeria booriae]MBC2164116.1 hypothetical protein [Listeria booriae]
MIFSMVVPPFFCKRVHFWVFLKLDWWVWWVFFDFPLFDWVEAVFFGLVAGSGVVVFLCWVCHSFAIQLCCGSYEAYLAELEPQYAVECNETAFPL